MLTTRTIIFLLVFSPPLGPFSESVTVSSSKPQVEVHEHTGESICIHWHLLEQHPVELGEGGGGGSIYDSHPWQWNHLQPLMLYWSVLLPSLFKPFNTGDVTSDTLTTHALWPTMTVWSFTRSTRITPMVEELQLSKQSQRIKTPLEMVGPLVGGFLDNRNTGSITTAPHTRNIDNTF